MTHCGRKNGWLLAKVILSLVLTACAVPAFQYARVATVRASSPSEAARIAPREARVLASTLGRRFEENPEFKPSAGDLTSIRVALTARPLESNLLSVLGLAYEAAGNTQQAYSMMQLAARASRRNVVSGLYLIEAASASGDVRKTLRHYNTVLSTQPELYPTLLPILVSAINLREVRTALRPYLDAGVRWSPNFIAAAAKDSNVSDLQSLLLPLPEELSREEYAEPLALALYRVAIQGKKGEAIQFAGSIIPGFTGEELSSLGISAKTLDKRFGSLAWTFPSVEGIQAEPNADNSIQISAEPLARGVVAVRDLLLEAGGKYQLTHSLEYGPEPAKIDARWRAYCINAAETVSFWEQRLPSGAGQRAFRGTLIVPQGCKVVRITLFAEGPDAQISSMLTIAGLILSR